MALNEDPSQDRDFEVPPIPPVTPEQLALESMLERARSCLKRWAARYAPAPHAKAHVKETNLLVEEIGEYLLHR